jgi:hypothetical protein
VENRKSTNFFFLTFEKLIGFSIMEIAEIKEEILKIYQKSKKLGDSYDDEKYFELYENDVRSLIISYCESKRYEVEGYPFQKRILGETDDFYDEDYFCFWRNVKYLDVLATTKDDVLDLLYFYTITFWSDYEGSKEEYKSDLLAHIRANTYDIEF